MEGVQFTTKHPIWEHGQEAGHTRPMDRDTLFKNLVQIKTLLDKAKIKWWVSHGTMLGFYRENNFIAWDDDADIGLDMRDRQKIYPVIEEAKKLGFFVPPEAIKDTIQLPHLCPYYDTVFIKDGEKIEGWWYDRKSNKNEQYYIYDEFRCGNILKHPAKYYDEIKTMKVRGVEFPIPNHIEDWLVMMYGEGWNKPDKNKKYNTQA